MKLIWGGVKLGFKRIHWIHLIIILRTGSTLIHMGVLDEERNEVIESKGSNTFALLLVLLRLKKNSFKYGGVIATPLEEFCARYDYVKIREVDGDIQKARRFKGKPYDVFGLFGLLFGVNIQNPSSEFCSEWIGSCLASFNKDLAYRATPIMYYIFSAKQR